MNATHLLLIASISLTACRSVPQAPAAGPLKPDSGGAVGYQHGIDKSRFVLGADRRTVSEFGLVKFVGGAGTFAVDVRNGASSGILNAAQLAALERKESIPPTPERHNQQVLEYFIAAGIPRDQVMAVDALTLLEAVGETKSSQRALPKVIGYQSALERGVDGIQVPDSVAWARISEGSGVLSEAVYWPAISGQVLAEAKRMQQRLAEPKTRETYLALVPPGLPAGEVVIHHSPPTMRESTQAVATYDVAAPIYAPGSRADANARPVSWVLRHFDANGREIRLPHEAQPSAGDARRDQ